MKNGRAIDPTLELIAKRCLGVDTLETRKSDALDFREYAIWQIREALEAAFATGVAAAGGGAPARSRNERKPR
jgi:hypothetical protein